MQQTQSHPRTQDPPALPGTTSPLTQPDFTWSVRSLSSDELYDLSERDPELSPALAKEILARLNSRGPYHVSEDIQMGRSLKVPHCFESYKDWRPLPENLSGISVPPRLIVVVKELPFLAWYESGRLVEDTYACVGRDGEETRTGSFTVLEKDADHYSRSYTNSYGKPAWMPWALRIYDTVWIHAGDVSRAKCSHGCIILPLDKAQRLYSWADRGTPVIIVETLDHLQ